METLTDHFQWSDVTKSPTAAERHIDNTLPDELRPNVMRAAVMAEAVRAYLGNLAAKEVHIIVTSWYRCPELNAAVGGSPTSDHTKGFAIDIEAPEFGTPIEVCRALEGPMAAALGIGQLIYEHAGDAIWTHISCVPHPGNEVISLAGPGRYVQGIVERS